MAIKSTANKGEIKFCRGELERLTGLARRAEKQIRELETRGDADHAPTFLFSQLKSRLFISTIGRAKKVLSELVGILAAVDQDFIEFNETAEKGLFDPKQEKKNGELNIPDPKKTKAAPKPKKAAKKKAAKKK